MKAQSIIDALASVQGANVLVIGDVMIDAYHRGNADRISPEAPVPVLSVTHRENRLGGAANVALNVKAMGMNAILCSIVGNDPIGNEVFDIMQASDLDSKGILKAENRITTVKTRMMSGHQQLLRVDHEQTHPLEENDASRMLEHVLSLMDSEKPRAIIFEDYDKGVINGELVAAVVKKAQEHGIIVTVDPKKRNFFAYAGVDLFKPNLRELKDGLGRASIDTTAAGLSNIFNELHQRMPVKAALFTLASEGVFITDGSTADLQAAHERKIADVSGAGDTVISVATCAMMANLNLSEVAFASNLAGGWVCQYSGVVSIEWTALQEEISKALKES